MAKLLSSDGFLILGHSENLYGITDRFVPKGNTIYTVKQDGSNSKEPRTPIAQPQEVRAPATRPIAKPRDPAPERNEIPPQSVAEKTIIAGEVFASSEPACVSTLLGSCVAACLYDAKAGVGGMNHFMLPDGGDNGVDSARFGINAMELLINDIMRRGGDRRRLQAKVFGGARVIEFKGKSLNIGERNAEFVREFLSTESIPIVKEYLGGTSGLKVRFLTHTGQAFVKAFDGNALTEIVRREERQSHQAPAQIAPPEDNVVLF